MLICWPDVLDVHELLSFFFLYDSICFKMIALPSSSQNTKSKLMGIDLSKDNVHASTTLIIHIYVLDSLRFY